VSDAVEDYRHARLPRHRTSWLAARWCAVDLELTGPYVERDEIVSFGAIPIERGRVRAGEAVYGLVRPIRPSSDESIRVHGIREIDLADAPPLEVAILPLLRAIAGRGLIVHAAGVERPFLGRALRELGLRLRNPIVDTEVLGRVWLHERERQLRPWLALAELASLLGLLAERQHDALGDALTTAQVFIALATHLDESHTETVSTLVNAARRLDAIRIFHLG
jgi:DNA polymerase III subunit epsilon